MGDHLRLPVRGHRPDDTAGVPAQAAKTFHCASFPICYGKEFNNQLFASWTRAASERHEFDPLCTELGIVHRLTLPKLPQTNGRVERFNGRIDEVPKTNRLDSALDLE